VTFPFTLLLASFIFFSVCSLVNCFSIIQLPGRPGADRERRRRRQQQGPPCRQPGPSGQPQDRPGVCAVHLHLEEEVGCRRPFAYRYRYFRCSLLSFLFERLILSMIMVSAGQGTVVEVLYLIEIQVIQSMIGECVLGTVIRFHLRVVRISCFILLSLPWSRLPLLLYFMHYF
jgi:hypothetical protein